MATSTLEQRKGIATLDARLPDSSSDSSKDLEEAKNNLLVGGL